MSSVEERIYAQNRVGYEEKGVASLEGGGGSEEDSLLEAPTASWKTALPDAARLRISGVLATTGTTDTWNMALSRDGTRKSIYLYGISVDAFGTIAAKTGSGTLFPMGETRATVLTQPLAFTIDIVRVGSDDMSVVEVRAGSSGRGLLISGFAQDGALDEMELTASSTFLTGSRLRVFAE